MKRMVWGMLFLWVFLFVVACASRSGDIISDDKYTTLPPFATTLPIPDPVLPQAPTDTPSVDPVIRAARTNDVEFTSTWARTGEALYFTYLSGFTTPEWSWSLYRVPFNNITQGTRLTTPLDGSFSIAGICTQYIYLSRGVSSAFLHRSDSMIIHFEVYRLSKLSGHMEWVADLYSIGAVFFHKASLSLLYATIDEEAETVMIYLWAMCVQNGERQVLYTFPAGSIWGTKGWSQMECGAVLFYNRHVFYLLVNENLSTEFVPQNEISNLEHWQPRIAQNAGEEYALSLNDEWGSRIVVTTVGDWVYYVTRDFCQAENRMVNHLYRISTNATDHKLLAKDTSIDSVVGLHGNLFARVNLPMEVPMDEWHQKAVRLSEYGDILYIFGEGWSGHNALFNIVAIPGTSLVAAMTGSFFGIDMNIAGLYCTATGAVFVPHD